MSYRGQQHFQRVATGKGSIALQPVKIKKYDPAADIACDLMKVPYSQVFVGGEPDHVRSHEKHLDNKDRSGFIDSAFLAHERQIARENRAWRDNHNPGNRTRERARQLRKRDLA